MKVIFGGHWCEPPPGWRVVSHVEQDIGQRLKFPDNSVDAIFTEHVVEHVEMVYGVAFMRDSLRILKPGGVFRSVMPTTEVLSAFVADARGLEYGGGHLRSCYLADDTLLRSIGLPGIVADPHPFLLDSLFKMHGHKFVWSGRLAAEVMLKLGYSVVHRPPIGDSAFDPSLCLERRVRGVPANGPDDVWDPQSGVVEARK